MDRFLADLETTLVAGEGGDAELARFLRVAVEQGQESRVPAPPDIETDAVHVMTIHRAKGLDFEHVYVAQIHKGSGGGGARTTAAMRRIGGRPEYRLFGWITPGFATAEWVQTKKTRAEMVRLLYVAATRAKKRLVISGGWRQPGDEVPPESASDFSRLIGHRLDPESVAQQIEDGADRWEDGHPHVARVMPIFAVRFESPDTESDAEPGWSFPVGRLERAVELVGDRRAAAARMVQPVFRSASAEAHDRLQRAEAEDAESVAEGASERGPAMALGTAVHKMLETLDLDRELAPQIEEHRAGIVSELASGRDGDEAGRRADELLTRIAEGECLKRLESVVPDVLSRELPVLLWSEEDGTPGSVVSGIVDLVYRDPEDGRLVVADYKTDRIEDDDALAERTRVYEPQVRIYARALQEALDLDHKPRTELWFLAADRIVRQ